MWLPEQLPNDHQKDPDIDLNGELLSSCLTTGKPALLLDLGIVSAHAVDANFAPPQDEISKRGWDLAWNFSLKPPSTSPGVHAPSVTPEDFKLFLDYRNIGRSPRAVVGHSYLVRSIIPGKHDHLVSFEILAEDEHGIFITWKILKTWPT